MPHSDFSDETIRQAYERQGGRCAACGDKLLLPLWNTHPGWDAHHIVPASRGGGNGLENCVLLCSKGNNCHLHIGHNGDWSNFVPVNTGDLPFLVHTGRSWIDSL